MGSQPESVKSLSENFSTEHINKQKSSKIISTKLSPCRGQGEYG